MLTTSLCLETMGKRADIADDLAQHPTLKTRRMTDDACCAGVEGAHPKSAMDKQINGDASPRPSSQTRQEENVSIEWLGKGIFGRCLRFSPCVGKTWFHETESRHHIVIRATTRYREGIRSHCCRLSNEFPVVIHLAETLVRCIMAL